MTRNFTFWSKICSPGDTSLLCPKNLQNQINLTSEAARKTQDKKSNAMNECGIKP